MIEIEASAEKGAGDVGGVGGVGVADELACVAPGSLSARRAEVAALLRFGAQFRLVAGRVCAEASVESARVAGRLRKGLADLCGDTAGLSVVPAGTQSSLYVVRVRDAAMLVQRVGLLDRTGRLVQGLPAWIVAGRAGDAAAAWRGAFMAAGALSITAGRYPKVQVDCPALEAAQSLAGLARRLGVAAKVDESSTGYRVTVRDGQAVERLLEQMGAHAARQAVRQALASCPPPPSPRRGGPDANRRRAAEAAAVTVARVQQALAVLNDTAPGELLAAGHLRLEHPNVSLEELGRLATPPMTKDTINGRIRRLLRAGELARQATPAGETVPGLAAAVSA